MSDSRDVRLRQQLANRRAIQKLMQVQKHGILALIACGMMACHAYGQDPVQVTQDRQVVAKVGDKEITLTDVDAYLGTEAFQLKQKLFEMRQEAIRQLGDALLVRSAAESQHVTVQELLRAKIAPQLEPTSLQIDRQWENNFDGMHQLGEVQGKYQVTLDLESHAKAEALRSYLNSLEKQYHFAVYLNPPKQVLAQHTPGELLKSGNRKEVVIYQDYECPFCRTLEPEIARLIQNDPTFAPVKITIKQLPLSIHKRSFEAAVAAVCSADQGHFREMHTRLIEDQDHSDHGLEQSAVAVGLDVNRFDQCMHSEKATHAVLSDMDDARQEGVDATPTVFIENNRVSLPPDPKDFQVFLDARLQEDGPTTSGVQQMSRHRGGQQ